MTIKLGEETYYSEEYVKELKEENNNLKEDFKRHIDRINELTERSDNLQEKINQYENPDDMTLFYMWLDEKAKDKMKQLQEENVSLNNQLEFIGEQNKYIDKLEYKIKRIVYSCYESDMSYDAFKEIWVNAFGKLYDPKDIDKLENELKGDNK